MAYHTPPEELPGFPNAFKVRPKTPFAGGGLRTRWKDDEGRIFEWDYRHGSVEQYDKRGRHVGEFDANTGDQLKPASPHRVEP